MKNISLIAKWTLVLTTLFFITSCNKNKANDLRITGDKNVSVFSELKKVSERYEPNFKKTRVSQRVKRIMLADALGALEGAEWGSIGGLWGALCGGVALGAYTSCLFSNIDDGGSPVTVTNADNSLFLGLTSIKNRRMGEFHNTTLNYFKNNYSSFLDTSSTIDRAALSSYCISAVCTEFGYSATTLSADLLDNSVLPYLDIDLEDPYAYFDNISDGTSSSVCENYFTDAFLITNQDTLIAFTNASVDIILQSTTLTNDQKRKISAFMEVGSYSIIYNRQY